MRIPTITVQRTVSMGHRLPSYKGLCSSPHGHNMRVEVEVAMLVIEKFLDFKVVDEAVRLMLEPYDHAMVLYCDDPLLSMLQGMRFRVVSFTVEPTTEALAEEFFSYLNHDSRWRCERVTVYETDKYSATVRA